VITEGDFYRDEHRRIYRQICKLLERGKPADAVTVAESLDQAGEGKATGGLAYLGELAANTPSAANIRRYAEIVRERAILRQLVTAGDEIAGSALNPLGRDPKTCSTRPRQRSSPLPKAAFAIRAASCTSTRC
jgi:replicative DNA helicase